VHGVWKWKNGSSAPSIGGLHLPSHASSDGGDGLISCQDFPKKTGSTRGIGSVSAHWQSCFSLPQREDAKSTSNASEGSPGKPAGEAVPGCSSPITANVNHSSVAFADAAAGQTPRNGANGLPVVVDRGRITFFL
jgi:hypothetical protein